MGTDPQYPQLISVFLPHGEITLLGLTDRGSCYRRHVSLPVRVAADGRLLTIASRLHLSRFFGVLFILLGVVGADDPLFIGTVVSLDAVHSYSGVFVAENFSCYDVTNDYITWSPFSVGGNDYNSLENDPPRDYFGPSAIYDVGAIGALDDPLFIGAMSAPLKPGYILGDTGKLNVHSIMASHSSFRSPPPSRHQHRVLKASSKTKKVYDTSVSQTPRFARARSARLLLCASGFSRHIYIRPFLHTAVFPLPPAKEING